MIDLAALGWQEGDDTCWLDCAAPGLYKRYRHREIVLCAYHAMILERGKWGPSYRGAPLPPDTVAIAWPWRSLERTLVRVALASQAIWAVP